MKYSGSHKSGADAEVYDFVLGKEELRVLRDCLAHIHKNIPESIETLIYRRRLRTMLKCIEGTRILARRPTPIPKTR